MTQSNPPRPGAISLDELIALNDEIAALVRAGVPLEQTMGTLAEDMPGRLGAFANMLAQRAARGQSLQQIVADKDLRMPPVYRAVIEAGTRIGRLPAALESLSASIRRLAETRRAVMSAALYPILILVLTCGAFAFFCSRIAPSLWLGLNIMRVPGRDAFINLVSAGRWALYWAPLAMILICASAAIWWSHSRRAVLLHPRWSGALLGWLPWIGPMLKLSRTAAFTEVLALLVENRVPLPEAVVLAAESCGDRRLIASARWMSAALTRGEPAAEAARDLPPLLRWLMGAVELQGILPSALRHAAESYRCRAEHQADMTRVLLPALLTLVVGGGAVLLYALSLFVPYTSMLREVFGGLP
jgi:type II secretory pathway component PulF